MEFTLGRDDHRPFIAGAPIDPIDRMARVDATGGLHRIHPGGLAGVPRVFVFVHGWTPGSQVTADLLYAQSGQPAAAWDDRISDLSGIPLVSAYMPLLTTLAGRDEPAAVIWFSWVDQSATDRAMLSARESLRRTEINGRRLAAALVSAIGAPRPGPDREGGPQVQLIGHSHGCVVATHAALSLPNLPAQLTLLDCPEDWFSRAGGAAGLLTDLLPRLQPGRAQSQVFVDSYASMFGQPYHHEPGLSDVVDVRLVSPIRVGDDRGAVGFAHEYAVNWYCETVAEPSPNCGFGWSRLAQGAQVPFERESLAASYFVVAHNRPIETAARTRAVPVQFAQVPLPLGELELSERDPDILIGARLADMHLVEFDYQISNPGPGTRVECAVDRLLVFAGSSGADAVPERGRYLRIPPAQDPSDPTLIQFRLANPGAGTRATIGSLQGISTPNSRNFTAIRTSATIAALGAAAGSGATLVALAMVAGIRRWLRGR